MNIKKRGFTLIELLVVVLIIGILAAVAVPQYQKTVYKSRLAQLKVLSAAIARAQEVYYLANDQYASTLEELDIDMPGSKNSTGNASFYDWGHCETQGDHSVCQNKDISMTIQDYFKYSNRPNAKLCVAEGTTDLTDIRSTICLAETGDADPTISGRYTSIIFQYQ